MSKSSDHLFSKREKAHAGDGGVKERKWGDGKEYTDLTNARYI